MTLTLSKLKMELCYHNSDSDTESESDYDYNDCDTMEDAYEALNEQRIYNKFFGDISHSDEEGMFHARCSYQVFLITKNSSEHGNDSLEFEKELEENTLLFAELMMGVEKNDMDKFDNALRTLENYISDKKYEEFLQNTQEEEQNFALLQGIVNNHFEEENIDSDDEYGLTDEEEE
jgi:hypothetical protein